MNPTWQDITPQPPQPEVACGDPCTDPEHDHEALGLICPNCGELATFTEHSGDFVETHGLDCGPYETWHEEWVTCDLCKAKTDWREIDAAQPPETS